MSRPLDHIDSRPPTTENDTPVAGPKLSAKGWLRWAWRQLTSMRTALFLLLAMAIVAVPGSLLPQRTADPNGVTQYFASNPQLAPALDKLQAFDVYSSVWFSSIYLLLFISLIGCIIPRTIHHARSLLAVPPQTPVNLRRFPAYDRRFIAHDSTITTEELTQNAQKHLKRLRYRTIRIDGTDRQGNGFQSISAERGYLRESGNLLFHTALIGVLAAVGIGGGFGFTGQRVVVEGQSFVNTLASYDSFNPGRFFNIGNLDKYSIALSAFNVNYEQSNLKALGQPVDFTAHVTTTLSSGSSSQGEIKVNEPLTVGSSNIYLLGNGYAPRITVKDPTGKTVFSDDVAFLPQDANLTSLGVVKVPDGLTKQLGMIGFLYPTQSTLTSGAYFSAYPDLDYPVLTLNVYTGDLGIDAGNPKSVYALDTSKMSQLTGGNTGIQSLVLKPGQTLSLPGGMGTVSLDGVKRFASLEVHSDPAKGWVLLFSVLAVTGLLTSLFIPRRRLWAKITTRSDGTLLLECAGLARGDDPRIAAAVTALTDSILSRSTASPPPGEDSPPPEHDAVTAVSG